MNGNKTVTASFTKQTSTVSTQAGQGGSINTTSRTVGYGETTQFTVEQFFDGHMAWTMNETTVTVYFEHSVNPVSPYELDTLTTKMKLTNNARVLFSDPQGSTSSGVTTFTIQRVVPFKHTPLNVLFTNPEGRIVETNRATITVLPSNFNDWRVTSNLIVENRGLLDVDTLKFTLPGDAYQVKVYDTFGAILGLKLDAPVGDYKNASLNLLLNRYKISTDTKFQFTLEYRLPAGNRISVGDERNMIHVPLDRFCTTPWLTRDLKVRFGLAGAVSVNFDSMVVPDEVDSIDGVQYIIYKKDLASPNSPAVIMIDYKFSNFSLQARPLIITVVSMIVLVAYVSLKKVKMVYGERKEGEGATLETPVEDLKEFTQLFEEKVGLYIEIEHLNDDYQKRKIKKREYSIRIEGSNKQLKELDLDIKKPKSRLIALGGRFKEIIDDLDVLEAERQSVQDTLMALEFRYKEGKIPSKAAFEKLYGENISKLKQIKNAIDSGLNELKGYFL